MKRKKRKIRSRRTTKRSKSIAIGFRTKRRKTRLSDARLQRALTILRDRKDIAAAARSAGTSVAKFKREVLKRKIIKKRGKNWIVSRDLHRQLLIYSDGKQVRVTLSGQRSARNAGKYMSAVGAFLRSNNIRILDQFIGRAVKDVAGKRHVFETNPNSLYRLASSTDEAFEAVYRIVVS